MAHENRLHGRERRFDVLCGTIDPRKKEIATLRKRKMIYYPIAAIVTLGMLAGIFGFINAEETALTTITPLTESEIYSPQQAPQP